MFKGGLTYALVAVVALGFVNPAIAEKKKKGSGIIKKAVAAYVVYKVVKHYKDKKEEQKAKNKQHQDHYVEPYYDEACEDEDECEEE